MRKKIMRLLVLVRAIGSKLKAKSSEKSSGIHQQEGLSTGEWR